MQIGCSKIENAGCCPSISSTLLYTFAYFKEDLDIFSIIIDNFDYTKKHSRKTCIME